MTILLLILSLFIADAAGAATLYFSSAGSGTRAGTACADTSNSTRCPFSQLSTLVAGDTGIIKNGTHNVTSLQINCLAGYQRGTAGNPITLQSETPRGALIKGDGSGMTIAVNNCSYWTFDNLRIENTPIYPNWQNPGYVFCVGCWSTFSDHITLKRSILRYPANGSGIVEIYGGDVSSSLVEDNELIDFVAYGMAVQSGAHDNVTRRNYINPRDAITTTGFNGGSSFSFQPLICYGCGGNNIFENNIIDIDETVTPPNGSPNGNRPTGFSDYGPSTSVLGNIIITPWSAALDISHHPDNGGIAESNGVARNNLVILGPIPGKNGTRRSQGDGLRSRLPQNALIENTTVLGEGTLAAGPTTVSYTTFNVNSPWGLPPATLTMRNNLGIGGGGSIGLQDVSEGAGLWAAGNPVLDYFNLYNYATPYGNGTQGRTNSTQTNPQLGSCMVYIPSTSPMKGAGANGSDIGANILYQYVNGALTSTPLWDFSQTGGNRGQWIARGATVTGVNDIAGSSLFDVHTRLGFGNLTVAGQNCPTPTGVTGGPVVTITSPPNGGSVTVNAATISLGGTVQ